MPRYCLAIARREIENDGRGKSGLTFTTNDVDHDNF